jgi:septum site-determining protein MinC
MTNDTLIHFKGINEGILVNASEGDWEDRKLELLKLVHDKESFFKSARVCLEVGDTILRVKEITQLRDRLSDLDVTLWAILSESEITNNNAQTLGIETSLPAHKEKKEENESDQDAGEKAVLVNRTLRAGYRVEAREHIIITGDVNPGAEIVSAGNVIVWGKLKGSAVAGVEGNLQSVVCALELMPTQLRIGEFVFPPVQKKGKTFPEVAYINNGQCKIELWNKEKGK